LAGGRRSVRSTFREVRKAARGRFSGLTLRSGIIFALKSLVLAGLLFVTVFLALVIFLPLPAAPVPQATEVYDIKGRPISSLFVENRTVVPSSDIPELLKKAVVAVEDKRFYSHHGFDIEAIGRAVVRNLKAREILEGGSTISQQLAKNLFLTHERTVQRKIIELVYTLKLEMRYTKDEILTAYLNEIYWGHGSWGCETASRAYFGRSAKELNLAEAALMAGIIRSPEYYSPYHNMERAVERRALTLALMREQGYITPEEEAEANEEPVKLPGLPQSVAPYFVSYVVSDIGTRHPEVAKDIYRGGYRVYTTLDLDMQKAAEEAFRNYMPKGEKDSQGITQPQGALVAIEPATGYIKALVGGRNWEETKLNRAYQVKRQPGSAFKIFLYTAAVDMKHPVTETKVCGPIEYQGAAPGEKYRPVDYGRNPYHYAPLTMRTAVAISDNVVATRWAQEVGPSTIASYAAKMGVKSRLEPTIPLALGVSEVTPLEMTVAAATLAAGGVRPEPLLVLKLVDPSGVVIEDNTIRRTPVLDEGTAYIVTSLLRSVFAPQGTASGLEAFLGNRPVAGKTGTTDDELEAWFVGYTKDLACSVYVGWDNREKSLTGTGAAVAGPVWAAFMGAAHRNIPVSDWALPENVIWAPVCSETGLLAGPTCYRRHYEVFRKDALPPVDTTNHFRIPGWLRGILFPEFLLPGGSPGSTQGPEEEHEERGRAPVVYPVEAPVPDSPAGAGPFGPSP
jgi:1A family penicillin-binding protein